MMKIGITGQNGFIGTHLFNNLELSPEKYTLIPFERTCFENEAELDSFVNQCEIIIHLAALNRHENSDLLYRTNIAIVEKLIESLKRTESEAQIIFSSSSQELKENPYGNSKKEGRILFQNWANNSNGSIVSLIIPNVFGPFGKPFYNSVVATFCHQLNNNEQPKVINDVELNMIFVDDLIKQIISLFDLSPNNSKKNVLIEAHYKVKVSEILFMLETIKNDKNILNTKLEDELKQTFVSYKKNSNKKKKVLILGSSGMAGHIIYKYLFNTNRYTIFDITFKNKISPKSIQLDIRNFNKLNDLFISIKPDVVINAIGVLINEANNNQGNAILVNSYFPHFLVEKARENTFKLIHLSTDCVFSGKNGNYKEDSFKDADDIYGRSKALGEINNNLDLTIRTSIIGPEIKKHGQGLFHWFMLLNQNFKINGFSKIYWSGVTTLELSKVIDRAIIDGVSGLTHLTNNNKISKFKLLTLINEIWKRKVIIVENVDYKSDKSFKDTLKIINKSIPDYKEMLLELNEFMIENNSYFNYNKYYKSVK